MFHRWLSTDDPEHFFCFVCGGMWRFDEDENPTGIDGTPATDCTPHCHHYPGECPEDVCNRVSDCNCLFCYS